jgi:hypothetical protein
MQRRSEAHVAEIRVGSELVVIESNARTGDVLARGSSTETACVVMPNGIQFALEER